MTTGIAMPGAAAGRVTRQRAVRDWIGDRPWLLVVSGYLAAALALNWRLWLGFGAMAPVGDPGPADNDLMAWFMRYAADAVAHGQLPALVTTALNSPHGISLMWNNSVLLPAVALAPVTLLGGPLASLTVLATLGYAGSAAAMYWLLRRHAASVFAAGLGGAVFGFSPGMVNAGIAHYGVEFAVFAPLLAEAALSLLTGRGRPLPTGAWLGLLTAAQLFTGEEMLYDVVIGCLLLALVLGASCRSAVRGRLDGTVRGLCAAAAVALLICGYALWTQFDGPLTEHGSPWPITTFGNGFSAFVDPQAQLVVHSASSAAYAAAHGALSAEYVAYLGPPLLVLVAAATVWYWDDLRVRAAGVTWAVLEALSLGANGPVLPLYWLQHLPLLGDMIPSRMSVLADAAAAAVLAFSLDLVRSGVPRTAGPLLRSAPVVVALLAVLPLVPRPVAAVPGVPVPAGWDTVFSRLRLPASASVLVVPAPYSQHGEAMLWQADTGRPGKLVAGWFLGPGPSGNAVTSYWGPRYTTASVHCLDALWQGKNPGPSCGKALGYALKYWHPAAVVADTPPGTPLARFLIGLLGEPAVRDGRLLGWRIGSTRSDRGASW
jgi:hypothetical protein